MYGKLHYTSLPAVVPCGHVRQPPMFIPLTLFYFPVKYDCLKSVQLLHCSPFNSESDCKVTNTSKEQIL